VRGAEIFIVCDFLSFQDGDCETCCPLLLRRLAIL